MIRAFFVGLFDGWSQPWILSTGMTYENLRRQAAWDYGANIGQALGRIFGGRRG